MEYNFREVEAKWRAKWAVDKTFKTGVEAGKPKSYVLDMFPYPSGAGLHVGHPLGYIASDIYARYKRLKGFNVLHPMGYDSFGLPAEQYAIQTGQHPAITTKENIDRYRDQLDKIGFSFDWDREVRTSDPSYYKWTQWIFIQLFNSWYNPVTKKAEKIETLIVQIEMEGKYQWETLSEKEKSDLLLEHRLAYLSETMVNWCPTLGTVLANDEVKDGVSERGGYPVERKKMLQWSLRITAYAERLLNDLEGIDWTESIKEAQRNWIGKSTGCSLQFKIQNSEFNIEVFTTRPDTIFGVSFMVIAPEHDYVAQLTSVHQKHEVEAYVEKAKNRSERERMADVKTVTGVFTGSYAVHPFTGKNIPIWIGDYVLAGYGTGAVMAVAGHDSRDYAFAKTFNLPIIPVVEGGNIEEEAYESKTGKMINSDFLNGLEVKDAMKKIIAVIEEKNLGKGKTNYRLRDAIFGRQRYWGEPIPVYYKDGIPEVLQESELPLILPSVDKYLPTLAGEPPLARAENWKYHGKYEYEYSTMPGWAGSSWYFLRYMDPHNDKEFVSKEAVNYWQNIDLYIGGSEHATGHLLYVRFWTKFLFDLGHIPVNEPAKKLINQGMIQGTSCMIYRVNGENKVVSFGLKDQYETTAIHIDVNIVENNVVDVEQLKKWRDDFKETAFELENGKLICGTAVEKMSKRWYNVVNPDDIVEKHGADCLRLYEMFLGPLELSKPWNTNSISGTSNFIRKLWRLFHDASGNFAVSDEKPVKEEFKALHKIIKKVQEDIENFSFNTSVSSFMIAVNELGALKCNKREILSDLVILISPYAPFVAEELWEKLGNTASITFASFPVFKEEYLVESTFNYPISFNGKTRFFREFDLSLTKELVEKEVIGMEDTQRYLEGKTPKKVIVVTGKIVNIVV
ncbi:MAG: leucine--tRNA ligase [Bacteroidetes bacterium]|nr:leucine--tRNA ligase [Bacteroidota bacterium]